MATERDATAVGTEDPELDLLFAAARTERAMPAALEARILSDAMERVGLEPDTLPAATVAAPAPEGFWHGLISALGGWPTLTGMAATTMAGVWLGFTAPTLLGSGLLDSVGLSTQADLSDLMPSAATILAEAD